MGDMDRLCTIIVVVGAIVLLVMGYNEMTRLSMTRTGGGTCGMRSTTKNEARSAKRVSVNANKKPKELAEDFHGVADEWQNDTPTPTHKEFEQDDHALRQHFSWDPDDEEVNKKFDSLKIDPHKVKHSANTRAINQSMDAEEPLGSRRTGMVNPMLQMYHGKCGGKKDEDIQLSKSCTWFGGTDAYIKEREKRGLECTDC